MTKETTKENPRLIMRVAVADTIKAIKPGTAVTFSCKEFTSMPSAAGVVSRLNSAAGRTEFAISTDDNGATYTITRHA